MSKRSWYPPGYDTPDLRRAWDNRIRPIADSEILSEILADASLTWTHQRYMMSDDEFARAWSEAVAQMTTEQIVDVAKFMSRAATDETENP